jgi:hypothetical protein
MPEEKRIKGLILDDGQFNAVVDLVDSARAIEVNLLDGVITFREGFGPERIHGWVLTPDAVKEFSVDRIEGQYGINLLYKRCGIITEHFVGFIRDFLTAQKWVERVNAIYQQINNEKYERSIGRTTNYRDCPVVNDILKTRVNIVQPGAYQYSLLDQPPIEDLTDWEDAYVERCLDLLSKETGVARQTLTKSVNKITPHDYDWISDRVMYDSDFEHRITQPLELIFNRQQRHDKIGVNNFCVVRSFALVYFKNSKIKDLLGLEDGKQMTSFREFLNRFKTISDKNNLLVCAPANQSVYYSFFDAHSIGLFDLYNHFSRRTDVYSLAVWLWQNVNNGLVACDLGEVYALGKAVAEFQGNFNNQQTLLEHVKVPYENPISVGFCYRKDDRMWSEIERKSLIDIIEHPSTKVKNDFKAFRNRVAKIGVEVIAA